MTKAENRERRDIADPMPILFTMLGMYSRKKGNMMLLRMGMARRRSPRFVTKVDWEFDLTTQLPRCEMLIGGSCKCVEFMS